jgi:hypothetical protein
MSVYRLLMPARRLDWGEAIVQGLFYGVLNFLTLYPLIARLASEAFRAAHPFWTWAGLVATLGLIPAAWPFAFRAVFKSGHVSKRIQIPYPTAWDYFFDLREPAFVLVHLRTGGLLGGLWGPKSYAGSFPNDGDIYLEAVYQLNPEGEFKDPIPSTLGALLRRDEYSHVEFFRVPVEGEQWPT